MSAPSTYTPPLVETRGVHAPSREGDTFTIGDVFTIGNVFVRVRNPERRWWQFWKPRTVESRALQTFRVTNVV